MSPDDSTERTRRWRQRQRTGDPLPVCSSCGKAIRGPHAPLCSRCWLRSDAGREWQRLRMAKYRRKGGQL